MNSLEIIGRIESGEISVMEGISLIKKSRYSSIVPSRKGNFMKIKVLDGKDNLNFTIPIFIISAGLSLARFAASVSHRGKVDGNARKALDAIESLDKKDIKLLVDELRKCKSLNFIEVHSNDSHVSISII